MHKPYTFDYIELTGVSKEEILRRAKKQVRYMNKRFGPGTSKMQDAIDGAIDAACEYNQGQSPQT